MGVVFEAIGLSSEWEMVKSAVDSSFMIPSSSSLLSPPNPLLLSCQLPMGSAEANLGVCVGVGEGALEQECLCSGGEGSMGHTGL